MFDGRFRAGVDRVTKPIGGLLRSTGLAPDHLTALGLVMAVPAAWAIATGRIGLGLGLLIGSAVPDLLDGALAKASGRASVRGAFFDSVADRVTDGLVLGAFAWYLQDTHRGHVWVLPVAVLGVSLIISYERAKAESLGFTAKGGLMERAERIIVICAALAFGVIMIPLLWLMLVLSTVTAIQRFARVWTQATAAGKGPPPAVRRLAATRRPLVRRTTPGAYEPTAVSVRWRAWMEANGFGGRGSWGERYGDRSRPGTSAARWNERRRARLARARSERWARTEPFAPTEPGRTGRSGSSGPADS